MYKLAWELNMKLPGAHYQSVPAYSRPATRGVQNKVSSTQGHDKAEIQPLLKKIHKWSIKVLRTGKGEWIFLVEMAGSY